MNQTTFTWQETPDSPPIVFSVRAQSALESNVFYSVLVGIARKIAEKRGFKIEDVPPSLDALITRFVQLMQTSRYTGGELPFPDSLDKVSQATQFDAWEQYILQHDALFTLWWNAYLEANKKQDDPN